MTLIQKIEKKADTIARKYHDDLSHIQAFLIDDRDDPNFGQLIVEFAEWGGPKMRGGKIVGDHDHSYALYDLEKFLEPFGCKLAFYSEGDDGIEHLRLHSYRLVFV